MISSLTCETLWRQNEARTEKDKDILTPASPPKNEIVDQRELDELLRFINGAEEGAAAMEAVLAHTPTDNKATAKAAKRARQKQRKVCATVVYCIQYTVYSNKNN